jgi:hypothetical protein
MSWVYAKMLVGEVFAPLVIRKVIEASLFSHMMCDVIYASFDLAYCVNNTYTDMIYGKT